jgi:hypothetical protein
MSLFGSVQRLLLLTSRSPVASKILRPSLRWIDFPSAKITLTGWRGVWGCIMYVFVLRVFESSVTLELITPLVEVPLVSLGFGFVV